MRRLGAVSTEKGSVGMSCRHSQERYPAPMPQIADVFARKQVDVLRLVKVVPAATGNHYPRHRPAEARLRRSSDASGGSPADARATRPPAPSHARAAETSAPADTAPTSPRDSPDR